jgi:cell division septation protein DedD
MFKKILTIGLCLPFVLLIGCATKSHVVQPEEEIYEPQAQQEEYATEDTRPLEADESLTEESYGPYSILLSSCQKQENARIVVNKYKNSGLNPYIEKVDLGKKGSWFRIYVGRYETREKAIAEKNKHGLKDKIILKR